MPGSQKKRFPVLALVALLLVAGLVALGVWQVQRLAWKRDLIARIEARVHAPPAPFPTDWSSADRSRDEYRRVTLSGHFLNDRATLVQAATVRGSGFWVMTPLATDGGTVLINRGFIPARAAVYAKPEGVVRITGLLRMTEPGGGFLRSNDAAANRWYSRDVTAIARALPAPVAPWFVDAGQSGGPDALPVGSLTVIRFPNNHLVYAITWFTLAAMVAGAYIFVMRVQKQPRP
ncbi:SURF1 family protein [Sphingobium aromaticiconvertens]|uniref:SURF1 family protein n=1 Tax=Sphingobium aromaticiconvertens TaxID=365341 RepID=UPI0030193A70